MLFVELDVVCRGLVVADALVPVVVFEPPPPLVSRTTTTTTTTTIPASSSAPPRLDTGSPEVRRTRPYQPSRGAPSPERDGARRRAASAGVSPGAPASASSAACARSRTALSGMPSSSATWA